MGTQEENAENPVIGAAVMRANFEGPASILAHLANAMEARGSGTLVGISSVAGDRGRASNYVYGSAKAGFTAFLSGLRNRLAKRGRACGHGAARLRRDRDDRGARPARAPDRPARGGGAAVVKAVQKQRNVIYVRPIWRIVMAVIRNIPEPIFKKTSI
jgi:decaprenylphospho-beta-D-erythro-pentofuranosid-2-ulose 2-reductase